MKTKQDLLFIVNPISGDIKKGNFKALVSQCIDSSRFNWEIKNTERAGHATHLAKEAVQNKVAIVVAVGGDGSINEVAAAVVNTNTALAIIPLGSGNGLAYHLKIPVRNIKKALQLINKAKVVKIDTLSSSSGLVVAFAGFGFEAVAARTYSHIGKRGFLAYTWATIRGLFYDYKTMNLRYEVDGKLIEEPIFNLSIYNAKYLGYKVGKLAGASMQDGKMNLVRIKPFPFWKVLWIVFVELSGNMHLAKETKIIEAKKVRVFIHEKTNLQLDGDALMSSQTFEIEVNALSLNILVAKEIENL